jgi:hypothetical protein
MVGRRAGVLVDNDASVVAMASSMGRLGVAVLVGNEQEAKSSINGAIIKKYLMHRLYSFSEQIKVGDVIWVKE